MLQIQSKLIPTSNKKTRSGIQMSPKYITVHTTANTSKGANALAHANLQFNGNSRTASWHFTVDDHSIYQSLTTNEIGLHAGDSNGPGNRQSIGIELCVNRDGNFEATKRNAAELIRYLMGKYDMPISNVVPHKRWSGKDCPHEILPYWSQFISQIKGDTTPTVSKPQTYDSNSSYHRLIKLTDPMMRGADVKRVQKRLQTKVVDGIYGPATAEDVRMWQRLHDEKGEVVAVGAGLDVDGIVGPLTWNALF